MSWRNRKVLVTGGASFIGSSLVGALLERQASVQVVDNLSSRRLENIAEAVASGTVEFVKGNLLDAGVAAGPWPLSLWSFIWPRNTGGGVTSTSTTWNARRT